MIFLNKSIKLLRKENTILESQLESIKKKYLIGNIVQSKNSYSRDGFYSNIGDVPNYDSKWKNSFFEVHQDIAETFSSGNLSTNCLNKYAYKSKCIEIKDEYTYDPFVALCSAVIPSQEGPKLYLIDPFGSIVSNPLKNTTLRTAETWINHILVAYIGLHHQKTDYPINRIQTLKYTLYD